MATIFLQARAKAQRGDYSGLFASEELYGRRYSGKQNGYSTPHRKLTPLEHSLLEYLMSFSEFDACSSTLAVTWFKRYKRRILTTQKTCTQQNNCCAKKYRPKWRIYGAYSMNNRKRQQ
jgi:hypothetical protein